MRPRSGWVRGTIPSRPRLDSPAVGLDALGQRGRQPFRPVRAWSVVLLLGEEVPARRIFEDLIRGRDLRRRRALTGVRRRKRRDVIRTSEHDPTHVQGLELAPSSVASVISDWLARK